MPCRCFFSFGFDAPATPLALPSRPRSSKNTLFFTHRLSQPQPFKYQHFRCFFATQ
ncbi:hypothetical protein NEIELOOT_00692 [Neisseria elongata subsp. glycolytica ATCC 29315]|uniref:Uncharacterized protein n=1 Tax=Neisseria elongata subsp. glycolytica ATCC 29315 TaxID=546263 RepID=D4DNQ8_NEIEG|nr:hypothetical protein NEIELOOT_00692 [Neisseria elongata subsp. glycolytica ATCC 29315]